MKSTLMYQKDENGTIISPGKFEGENQETVDYWEKAMDGMADEEITDIYDTQYSIFYVSNNSYVIIYCDNNGFIYKEFLNKEEKNKLISKIINTHLSD